MLPRRIRPLLTLTVGATLAFSLAACGGDGATDDAETLTVYSGRNEELVAPLIEQFEEATGTEVEVRYGDTAEVAAQLLEEGERTEADVFLAQDAGALGAMSSAGLFAELPQESLDLVDPAYRAEDGTWVGTSGRARVAAYDPEQVEEADLPESVFDLTDPQWEGKVAYAPTNASFQAFITAMRVLDGEERTKQWLEDMEANGWQAYENNLAILDAVDAGEIELGLINHYYWFERAAEEGAETINAQLHYLPGGAGALVNVAGVGILAPSENAADAQAFVDYLLSEEGQTYFADETKEYPLIDGVTAAEGLEPIDTLDAPDIDLSQLESLQETLALLEEVGAL